MTRLIALFFLGLAASVLLTNCGQQRQPRGYDGRMTGNDSMIVLVEGSDIVTYHSQWLGIDIRHPEVMVRQEPRPGVREERFLFEDVSLTVAIDSIDSLAYSPGQQLMGMGAELLAATDRYSLHTGNEEGLDYYAKVIEDSLQMVTITLRYLPEHEEAVQTLKLLVNDMDPTAGQQPERLHTRQ